MIAAVLLPFPSRAGPIAPALVALHAPGEPCPDDFVDRTFSTITLNVGDTVLQHYGQLYAGPDGEAHLRERDGREWLLVSDASRADDVLLYPGLNGEVGVWARTVLKWGDGGCDVMVIGHWLRTP